MEDGDQVVVAVVAQRADGQVQVDLGRHPNRDRWWDGEHPTTLRGPRRSRRPRRGATSVRPSRAKSSTVSRSARAAGRSRRPRSACSAASGPPAQPASAARSALRRCAKAASITANTALRSPGGGSRRSNASSPESTPGTGQNTARGTGPARRAAANQASFALGTPYALLPGPGGQPLGHLGLHHDQPAAHAWAARPAGAARTGTADVVGQVGHQRGRRRGRQVGGAQPQRVGGEHGEPVGQRGGPLGHGARQPRRPAPGRSPPRAPRGTAGSRARVSEPSPGPTSSTTSSGVQLGGADDAAHGVGVVHEVLAEPLGRPQPELVGQGRAPRPGRAAARRSPGQRAPPALGGSRVLRRV